MSENVIDDSLIGINEVISVSNNLSKIFNVVNMFGSSDLCLRRCEDTSSSMVLSSGVDCFADSVNLKVNDYDFMLMKHFLSTKVGSIDLLFDKRNFSEDSFVTEFSIVSGGYDVDLLLIVVDFNGDTLLRFSYLVDGFDYSDEYLLKNRDSMLKFIY